MEVPGGRPHVPVATLLEHPVELVEMPVGLLTLHGGGEVCERERVVEARRVRVRLPDLEVGLAVQVRRLHEGDALRFTEAKYGRDLLVDLDNRKTWNVYTGS